MFQPTEGSNFWTKSFYVNDRWRLSKNLTLNLGVRYDKKDGSDQEAQKAVKDSKISPRLGISWDPLGEQKWVINASYGVFVMAIANSQANVSSAAGSPANFTWTYTGPPVNADCSPSNPGACLSTEQILQQFWQWFDSIGGTKNTNYRSVPSIPGGNMFISKDVVSPDAREYVLYVARSFGSKGSARLDCIKSSGIFLCKGPISAPGPWCFLLGEWLRGASWLKRTGFWSGRTTPSKFPVTSGRLPSCGRVGTPLWPLICNSLAGSRLEFFLQPEVRNIFNHEDPLVVNATVFSRSKRSDFSPFNPFTETSQECPQGQSNCAGFHWQKGPDFGKPTTADAYQTPRTFLLGVFAFKRPKGDSQAPLRRFFSACWKGRESVVFAHADGGFRLPAS
ncbi:MAG: TonB-dependent receptor domain-containing protein [Thermoanaerobaculaceae bacterium]